MMYKERSVRVKENIGRINISSLKELASCFARERITTRDNGGPDSLSAFIAWMENKTEQFAMEGVV